MLAAARNSLVLLAVLATPAAAAATDEPQDSTEEDVRGTAEDGDDELRWDEQVEVRVVLGETASAPLGASSTVIEPGDDRGMPSTLTEIVAGVPGVAENGQGGLFQVFSIRGVSRQRVTSLISGMRISSERRAGVSTSFIDPTLMGSVEVVRGPATTFYGSGALGGVVQILPRTHDDWTAGAGYDSNGDEHFQTFGTGGDEWSVGVAHRRAADGEAADGTQLNSHFTQYSAVLQLERTRGSLRYELMAIPTYAEDIGKPNSDFPDRTTIYPRERHGLVRFGVESDKGWRVHAFTHVQDLETRITEARDDVRANVDNESTDYGARWEDRRSAGSAELRYGIDAFGRRDVDATETETELSTGAETKQERTLDGAEETELGGFASARWERGRTRWEVGSRYTWGEQSNTGFSDRDRNGWSGFAGVARSFGTKFELRGGVSTGLRFPSLTEQFFTGTTGRGVAIGNPDLDEERSFDVEASLRWIGRRVVWTGVVFRTEIDDYIERVDLAPDLRTWVNLSSGTIDGIELQAVAHPADRWSLSWGGHLIDGEDDDGVTLADTPPDELYLGATRHAGAWTTEARLRLRDDRSDPGPGEMPIHSAQLLGASVLYRWSGGWEVGFGGTNLLDEDYFPSADDKAVPAAGRAFTAHVTRRH